MIVEIVKESEEVFEGIEDLLAHTIANRFYGKEMVEKALAIVGNAIRAKNAGKDGKVLLFNDAHTLPLDHPLSYLTQDDVDFLQKAKDLSVEEVEKEIAKRCDLDLLEDLVMEMFQKTPELIQINENDGYFTVTTYKFIGIATEYTKHVFGNPLYTAEF